MTAVDIKNQIKIHNKLIKEVNNQQLVRLFSNENKIIENMFENELNEEFKIIINPIIVHPKFIETRTHLHHDNISTYLHALQVSYLAYRRAREKDLDYISAARAGLLHDFYLYDWHETNQKEKGIFNMHLFSHPIIACKNAKKYFPKLMNEKIENAILAHSWHAYILKKIFKPIKFKLSNHFPKYKESWIVSKADIMACSYSAKSFKSITKSLGMDKLFQSLSYKILRNNFILVLLAIFR